MTFDATETGVAVAQPVELFKFTGTFNTYRLTSAAEDITNTDGTYVATAIKRNKLKTSNQEETNIALELELPYAHPMVTEYAFDTSPPSLILEFFRAHRNDVNDTLQLWKGQVIAWTIEGRKAKLQVPNILSYALDQPVPPPKYQGPCNHVLGDALCGVDLTAAENEEITTISAIDGTSVTVAASSFATDECAGGEMIVGDERRMIVNNDGTSFTIATAFAGVSVSDSVTIHRGCDHTLNGSAGCINRFDNGDRFGGFPLVPDRNPFSSRI